MNEIPRKYLKGKFPFYLNHDYTLWTFDTGSSEHITNNKSILSNYTEFKLTMKCANNTICHFDGYGSYKCIINGFTIVLNKVLYSSKIIKSIISGIKLSKEGINTKIYTNNNTTYLTLLNSDNKIINTFPSNSFNIIKIPIINLTPTELDLNYTTLNDSSKLLWHKRLGYFYLPNIDKYINMNNITNNNNHCTECKIPNLKHKPHNKPTPKASKILEIIHSDIVGPLEIPFTNKKYFITFIDEYLKRSWIYFLKDKSEAIQIIIDFFNFINNYFNEKIKFFKSDNAKEYKNKKIKKYCKKYGIYKSFSTPYNPQNNGIAERFNQPIISCARNLLYSSGMSTNFWDFAIMY
eukprot:jgi/Orpsp1_1/1192497/evm.model.d7180000093790.1